jgi:hypothetical protein
MLFQLVILFVVLKLLLRGLGYDCPREIVVNEWILLAEDKFQWGDCCEHGSEPLDSVEVV